MIVETRRRVRRLQRWLLYAGLAFAVILMVVGNNLLDDNAKIKKLTDTNTTTVNQLKAAQAAGRANRIAAQERTDEKVRQLACIIVSQTDPKDPKLTKIQVKLVAEFRKEYQCPPYSKSRDPFAPLPAATSSVPPTGSSRTPASGTPGGSGSTGSTRGGGSRPQPSRTPSSTPTSRATQPSANKPSSSPTHCIISSCVAGVCVCVA